jgi:hypothetical protein
MEISRYCSTLTGDSIPRFFPTIAIRREAPMTSR